MTPCAGRRNGDRKKPQGVLAALAVAAAAAWFVWGAAWLVPQGVELAAAWALGHTIAAMGIHSVGAFGPKAIEGAARYFLSMLRWQAPGVAGLALGAALWVAGLRRGDRRARLGLPLALAVGAGQLLLVNYSANPTVPGAFYAHRPPVLGHFEPSQMPYRYCDIFGGPPLAAVSTEALEQPLDFASVPAARNLNAPAPAAFQERLLLEHGGMLENAEGISNVDPEWSFPVPLYQFWVFALHRVPGPDQTLCLMGRSNVRYEILGLRGNYGTARHVAPVANGTPFPSYLYENGCFLPRAYVAARAVYSPHPDETLARLADPGFDARNTVLLESKDGMEPFASAVASAPAGKVESFRRSPNSVTLQVNLSRPGYVALLDRFDPNWHATIDGHEVPLLRANLLFRAVRAGAGRHTVRFFYRQRWLAAGLAVSLGALGSVRPSLPAGLAGSGDRPPPGKRSWRRAAAGYSGRRAGGGGRYRPRRPAVDFKRHVVLAGLVEMSEIICQRRKTPQRLGGILPGSGKSVDLVAPRHNDVTRANFGEPPDQFLPPAGQPPGGDQRQVPDKAHGRAVAAEIINQRLVSPHVDAVGRGGMALEKIDHAQNVAEIFGCARPGIAGIELRRALPPLVESPVIRYRSHHRPRQAEGSQVRKHHPGENPRHTPVAAGKVTRQRPRAFEGLNAQISPENGKKRVAGFKVVGLIANLHSQRREPGNGSHQRRR